MLQAQGIQTYSNEATSVFTNRTGAATVIGGVYAVDTLLVDGDSGSIEAGAGNVLAVATAKFTHDLVIATQVLADNETGVFIQASGDTPILVDGTTDVLVGDPLIPVDAVTNLAKQGAGSLVLACGQALEGRTTNSAGLVRCRFEGRNRWRAMTPAS